MGKLPIPLAQLVQENLSIVMMHSFSRMPLEKLLQQKFIGDWKRLRRMVFESSEQRAVKACLELAIFLRALDDEQKISDYLAKTSGRTFGRVNKKGNSMEPLKLREVANKIIHASSFEWDFSIENRPLLICLPRDNQKWIRAEINIVLLAVFCGDLIA